MMKHQPKALYFMIVPHNCPNDKPTPVLCNDVNGFVRDWMPERHPERTGIAIRRCLRYESPQGKRPHTTNQKVGEFEFYPLIDPPELDMTSATPFKTSTVQNARTLGQYLKMLTPEQTAQALLLIESGVNESTTGIETAIRYAQSCIAPAKHSEETAA